MRAFKRATHFLKECLNKLDTGSKFRCNRIFGDGTILLSLLCKKGVEGSKETLF